MVGKWVVSDVVEEGMSSPVVRGTGVGVFDELTDGDTCSSVGVISGAVATDVGIVGEVEEDAVDSGQVAEIMEFTGDV